MGMSEQFVAEHWDSAAIDEFFRSLVGLEHLPLSFAPHASVTLDGNRWTIAHAENGHYLLERVSEDGRTIHRTCNDAELLAENAPSA